MERRFLSDLQNYPILQIYLSEEQEVRHMYRPNSKYAFAPDQQTE